MKKSQIFFAFITPSWGYQHNPVWPKKEWDMWRDIKKDTYSYDYCIGFSLNNSVMPRPIKRKKLFLPRYISELISYTVSFDKDDYYNTILHKVGPYEIFINRQDKENISVILQRYIDYFNKIKK